MIKICRATLWGSYCHKVSCHFGYQAVYPNLATLRNFMMMIHVTSCHVCPPFNHPPPLLLPSEGGAGDVTKPSTEWVRLEYKLRSSKSQAEWWSLW